MGPSVPYRRQLSTSSDVAASASTTGSARSDRSELLSASPPDVIKSQVQTNATPQELTFVNSTVSKSNLRWLLRGPEKLISKLPAALRGALHSSLVVSAAVILFLVPALLIDLCRVVVLRAIQINESYERYKMASDSNQDCGCRGKYRVDHYATILLPMIVFFHDLCHFQVPWRAQSKFRKWLSRHPLDQHVASNDEIWRNDSPINQCHIIGMGVFDPMTIQDLQRLVVERWVLTEHRMRSFTERRHGRLVWSTCNFVDSEDQEQKESADTALYAASVNIPPACLRKDRPTFKISDIIHETKIPFAQVDGTRSTPAEEAAIFDFVSHLASVPFRENLPLWEMFLVNVPGRSHVIFRCHHTLMDGVACAYALSCLLFDQSPNRTLPPPPNSFRNGLFFMLQVLRSTATVVPMVAKWLFWIPVSPSMLSHQPKANGEVLFPPRMEMTGRKRLAPVVAIPLLRVKALSHLLFAETGRHFTVHDILTTCFVQAADDLRRGRGLEIADKASRGERWKVETSRFVDYKRPTRSTAELYVTRPDDRIYTVLPMTCRTSLPSKLDNFTSAVQLALPFTKGVRDNSGESLWSWEHLLGLQRINSDLKKNQTQMLFFIFGRIISKSLPTWLATHIVDFGVSKPICTVSNVMGPTEREYLGGNPMHSIQFWAPARGAIPVGVAYLSYNGVLQISVSLDHSEFDSLLKQTPSRGQLADLSRALLGELMVEKFNQLENFVKSAARIPSAPSILLDE